MQTFICPMLYMTWTCM